MTIRDNKTLDDVREEICEMRQEGMSFADIAQAVSAHGGRRAIGARTAQRIFDGDNVSATTAHRLGIRLTTRIRSCGSFETREERDIWKRYVKRKGHDSVTAFMLAAVEEQLEWEQWHENVH